MGRFQVHICCYYSHLLISLVFIIISSLSQVRYMAEGRAISKHLLTAQVHTSTIFLSSANREKGKVTVGADEKIGSSPPRCQFRCSSCGHCEAIQVPVAPRFQRQTSSTTRSRSSSSFSYGVRTIEYSRGDDITNYKPMSWKCKCGDFIFNP